MPSKFPGPRPPLLLLCLICLLALGAAHGAGAEGSPNEVASVENGADFGHGGASHLAGGDGRHLDFPHDLDTYDDAHIDSLWGKLAHRVREEPFNLIATVIFFCSILHTFMAGWFIKRAHRIEHAHERRWAEHRRNHPNARVPVSFKAVLFHFLGEIEAVFGIWLVPLIIAMVGYFGFAHLGEHGLFASLAYGWDHVTHYFHTMEHYPMQGEYVNRYAEPIFVVVIMAMASTSPIISLSEKGLRYLARLGKETPAAWWFSILTVAPLLGSFITEPAAMTVAALLLGRQFYDLQPSSRLKFATIGLLFVNVSVGGTLTNFAAPPVLMVQNVWGFDIVHMASNFGWKAATGIVLSNLLYFAIFRAEFTALAGRAKERSQRGVPRTGPVPGWIIAMNLVFLGWTVFVLHHFSLVILGFLFFLAFAAATRHYHERLNLRGPILVGFFLASLVTHGGLQSWWIAPVLSGLNEFMLFAGATALTAFNDNAAITFLASLVPEFNPVTNATEVARGSSYAVVAGAVTGGGLTVIANAPNPAGQSLLSRYFDAGAISPLYLMLGALGPTLIMAACFLLLPSL